MNGLTRKLILRAGLAAATSLMLTGLSGCTKPEEAPIRYAEDSANDATFYLVRHAEKELEGDDPALSALGYKRADDLAVTLRDVKFDAIYSTDTRRTRETAAPTLAQTGLDLMIYDGRALTEFAQELSDKSGDFLIVGHSNTTPQLADALGGEGGDPIVEANEYDRLYVIKRTGGIVVTELRRFP